MFSIDNQEVSLVFNKGLIGAWQYEKAFKQSLTNDLYSILKGASAENGVFEDVQVDAMLYYKLVYIMGNYNNKMDFEQFLSKVPSNYNFMDDYIEVIEKAMDCYFPSKKEEEKE